MKKSLRALMIDDSENDVLLIVRELKQNGYTVTFERVDDPAAMIIALKKHPWDIVIADYVMPQFSGLKALKMLQSSGLDLPFIIVSGKIGEDIAVEAMKSGAHDYILKNNLTRLAAAVERELQEATIRHDRKRVEKKYSQLLEDINDGYALVQDTKIVFANKRYSEIFGYDPRKMLGIDIKEFVASEELEKTTEHYYKVLRGEEQAPERLEASGRKEDGTTIQIEASIRPIEYNSKPAFGVIVRDITQRKQAEEALAASRASFHNIVEKSEDGIVVVNEEGTTKYINTTAESILSQKYGNLIEKSFDIQRLYSDEVMEIEILRNNGEPGIAETCITETEWEGNRAYLVTIHDITARKRAEEALRELDRLKSEFVANVSHELRTPLQSILGFTKLMMRGKVPDPTIQQEFLSIINSQGEHLAKLINNLVDVSRMESGHFGIQKQPLSMKAIIKSAIQELNSLASEKSIEVVEDMPAALPEVEADEARLKQVMVNLLSNAFKFSNEGSEITMRAENHDGEVLVQISDHGIGIPTEAIPHLFERFYQVNGTSSRSTGGSGLGLYISKQIIEAHGGQIWVESDVDKGSTFSFTVPLDKKRKAHFIGVWEGERNGKENISHRR